MMLVPVFTGNQLSAQLQSSCQIHINLIYNILQSLHSGIFFENLLFF